MAMLEKKNKSGKSNYFKEVGKELKKVTYPTPAQVRKNTIIVIVLSIIVGIFIAALDWGFGTGAGWLLQKDSGYTDAGDYGDMDFIYDEEGNIIGYYQENGEPFIFGNDIYEEGHDPDDGEDHTGHNHD